MSALKKKMIFHNISFFLDNNPLLFFFNYNHMSTEEWRILKNQFSKIEKVNTLVVKNKIANKIIKKNDNKEKITPYIANNTNTTIIAKKSDSSDILKECDKKAVLQILASQTSHIPNIPEVTNRRFVSQGFYTFFQKCNNVGDVEDLYKGDNKYSPNTKKENSFENIHNLFQGPTLLIGVSSLEQSKQVLYYTRKEKKLIFVGGLYKKKQINHLDLDYLLKLEKGVHANLINTLQYPLYSTALTTQSVNLYYLLKFYKDKKCLKG